MKVKKSWRKFKTRLKEKLPMSQALMSNASGKWSNSSLITHFTMCQSSRQSPATSSSILVPKAIPKVIIKSQSNRLFKTALTGFLGQKLRLSTIKSVLNNTYQARKIWIWLMSTSLSLRRILWPKFKNRINRCYMLGSRRNRTRRNIEKWMLLWGRWWRKSLIIINGIPAK